MTQKAALFERFLARDNFQIACKRVMAKGARGGVDRAEPADYAGDNNRWLDKLLASLRSGAYTPEPVAAVHVPKFGKKGGYRELGLPTVTDKIVQAALLQVVEPLAEKLFYDTSYGYRPGKGAQKALRRVEHCLGNRHLTWLVSQDIDNFFDTLDHDRLLSLFSDLVRGERRLVELVSLWCRMGIVQKDGRWRNVMTGVRQGQVLSPLLANLYLHDLDRFVQEHDWGWVRYADDFLLLCRDEAEAVNANQAVSDFLRSIRLSLNDNPNPVTSLEQGFDFLGVRFQGATRSIAPDKIAKMERTVAWQLSPKGRLDLAAVLKKLTETVEGWRHYYGFLSPWETFSLLNRRIDAAVTELLDVRRKQGIVTKESIRAFMVPHLPTGEGGRDTMAQVPILTLWKEAEVARPEQQPEKSAAKKIRKRRRQYVRKEVIGNELFVATPGAFIGKRGERIIVRNRQILLGEMPVAQLRNIAVAGGGVSLSSDVIRLCAERGISLTFLDDLGKPYAVAKAPSGVETELVLRQLEYRDGAIGLELARMFVWGKMKNQLALLKSYCKYQGRRDSRFARDFADHQGEMVRLIADAKELPREGDSGVFRQKLMGLEGRFAASYWRLIGRIIPEECRFPGRDKQGATDLVNSLLNYGYGILYSHTLQAVIKSGLNATIGFLHACQPGRPALVFDLVEEFRTMAVDRAVFSLVNRREEVRVGSDRLLVPESRKKLAGAVLDRLGGLINLHGRHCSMREGILFQAQAIRECLMGSAGYHPFLARW
jgi:group II intron reverse transcriptase/maturase/CRISPR-associated endonuclease Cas1